MASTHRTIMTDLAQLLDAICLSVKRDGIAFAATAREWTEMQTMVELKPCPNCGAKMDGAE